MKLSPGKSIAGKSLLAIGALIALNSAYLAAFGDPNLFYILNVLLHPALGVLAVVLALILIRRYRDGFSGWAGRGSVITGAVAAAAGLYLAIFGMTRPHTLALYVHVIAAIAASLFLLIWLRLRVTPTTSTGEEAVKTAPPVSAAAWRLSASVMLIALAFYGVVAIYHRVRPDPLLKVQNPAFPPLTMDSEGGGASNFMFPSSAQTPNGKPIKSEFFMDSESCRRCHSDIYDQWQSSMHHFASFNNQWYRKAIEYMQDVNGVKSSLWCGGCHDHALILAGKMQKGPVRDMIHLPESQNGLGCMSCHAIVHVGSTMGQGGFMIEYPSLSEYAASNNPIMRLLHDYVVRLDPKPHRNAFLKPFHRDPQQAPKFCSSCHKVHLDVPVNNYRWIRGFDDYDNWQASGVSGQGARSFYYPPHPSNCVDCHMPMVRSKDFGNIGGFVHNHRFAAANTAVPASYGDQDQLHEVEDFLKGAVTVDIFGVAEEPAGMENVAAGTPETPQLASTFAVGEESSAGLAGAPTIAGPPAKLIAPLGRVAAKLHRGETARVEVVVRTRKLGHFFPGGTVDAFDCWVELQGRDSKGRLVFWSGEVAEGGKGPVEPGAHFYRSLQLDAHGNIINKRNAWSTRATVYAHLIPPGAADTVHFRLKVPEDCGDAVTFTAKVNYRKFSWYNTQFAFAGTPENTPAPGHEGSTDPLVAKSYDDRRWRFDGDLSDVSAKAKRIPDVPTVVLSAQSVTVPVTGPRSGLFEEALQLDPRDRERWNDYGIGLLLQGDLNGAERAFDKVTQIDPKYADGWVNVARARVQEGNIEAAKPALITALKLNPDLASAHYFYGLALKTEGDYPEAYNQFAQAAARYPHDRVNRNQMGRMLFLQRKYSQAIEEYRRTLSVDPEDLEAHYNLMLCYRGLGDNAQSAREEKLYLRFKADEASRAITGPFKLAHAEDNNEALPIHEHDSVPLNAAQGGEQHARATNQSSNVRDTGTEVKGTRTQGNASPGARREVGGGASSR
jgi:Flp pilus assembly protein TadD